MATTLLGTVTSIVRFTLIAVILSGQEKESRWFYIGRSEIREDVAARRLQEEDPFVLQSCTSKPQEEDRFLLEKYDNNRTVSFPREVSSRIRFIALRIESCMDFSGWFSPHQRVFQCVKTAGEKPILFGWMWFQTDYFFPLSL